MPWSSFLRNDLMLLDQGGFPFEKTIGPDHIACRINEDGIEVLEILEVQHQAGCRGRCAEFGKDAYREVDVFHVNRFIDQQLITARESGQEVGCNSAWVRLGASSSAIMVHSPRCPCPRV